MNVEYLKYSKPVIDAHAHVSPLITDRFVNIMDELNIEKVVVLSFPAIWTDWKYTGEGTAALVKYLKSGRFILFTSVDLRARNNGDFGEKEADRIEECVENGSQGIKMYFSENGNSWYRSGLAVNDKRMKPIYEKCAELGIPILIHFNFRDFVPQGTMHKFLFGDGGPFYDASIPTIEERLVAFERKIYSQFDDALSRHTETNFIAAHSLGHSGDLKFISKWLRSHPNLYIELSGPDLCRNYVNVVESLEAARGFFIEFADRIVYGADLSYRSHRNMDQETWWKYVHLTMRRTFECYPPEGLNLTTDVLDKIYHKNIDGLLSAEKPFNMDYFVKNLRRDLAALEDYCQHFEVNLTRFHPEVERTAPRDKKSLEQNIQLLKSYVSKFP